MELNERYSIVFKGLADGAHDFVFDVGDAFFAACDNDELRGGSCKAYFTMRKAGSTMTLDAEITGNVTTVCDRCLEECSVPVEFRDSLTVRVSDHEAEYDGETLWVSPAEDEIALGQYIYESVVLAMPYRRVHAEGGCNPEMLSRFTVATAEEFDRMEQEVEQRQMHGLGGRDMQKLAALKARMESEAAPHDEK